MNESKHDSPPFAATGGSVAEHPLIRHSALMAAAAPNLKKRTLTNLYNERPTWLKLAHEKLDRATLAAYASIDPEGHWEENWATLYTETGAGQGFPKDHPQAPERAATDQKILTNLLRLNHQRTALPGARGAHE